MHHYHHRAFYIGVGCVALIAVGQMTMALVIDHFGLFGLARHEISPCKHRGHPDLTAPNGEKKGSVSGAPM